MSIEPQLKFFLFLFSGSRPQSSEGDQAHLTHGDDKQKMLLLDPMAINMIPPELEENNNNATNLPTNEDNVNSLEERLTGMRIMDNSLYGPRGSLV